MIIISGIYVIACMANSKLYVGSSKNIRKRWATHKRQLNTNKHPNKHLQSAWDKYGVGSFVFSVIEITDDLLYREQYWLQFLMPYDECGFNIALDTKSPAKGLRLPVSSETKEKISKANKGREFPGRGKGRVGHKHTDDTKAKISSAHKGRKRPDGTGAKISATQIANGKQEKLFIVTTPDGIELNIKGLSRFCREYGLNKNSMLALSCGKGITCKGWKCRHA